MVALSAQIIAAGSESDLEDGETFLIQVGATASGATPTISLGQRGATVAIKDMAGNVPPAGFLAANTIYQATLLNEEVRILSNDTQAEVTATVAGLTTGLIPANARFVAITSASADSIVTLPAGKRGMRISAWVGANGCEVRTPDASAETINAVDADGTNEAAIPATTLLHFWCVADGTWIMQAISELGAVITAIIPDTA